jgi:hypothetical protein
MGGSCASTREQASICPKGVYIFRTNQRCREAWSRADPQKHHNLERGVVKKGLTRGGAFPARPRFSVPRREAPRMAVRLLRHTGIRRLQVSASRVLRLITIS